MNRLTEVDYWEESWWKRQRPRRLWLYRDFDFETVRILREAAGPGRCRVIELGGGGSRVLPYLARKLGFEVFGSDFSLAGCRLLQANLALQRVRGGVVCEDIFQSSIPEATFELVYSSGLIEHFDDLRAVVAEHLRLLKPGGRLVLIVPNLEGIQGKIFRRLSPPLWERHRVFGPRELMKVFESSGLEEIRSGYLGSFFIFIGRDADWTAVRGWPGWSQFLVSNSVRLANGLISFMFRLLPLRPHTRALSPAFFAAGRRAG